MDCFIQQLNHNVAIPFECNRVNGSANLITGHVEYSNYGYEPNHAWTYVFLIAFGIGFVAQLLLSIFWRCWWTLPTLTAGTAVELIGWGGRLWSVLSWRWEINQGGFWDSAFDGYIMQICCLVIAPTFFSAANYILFGRIIANAGPAYVSLHAQSFSTIFVIADILCLVIQGAGGGIAGTADDTDGANMGAYIMTGGVVLQLVVTIFFSALFVEWLWRRSHDKPARRQFNPFGRFYKNKTTNDINNNRSRIEMSPSATLTEEYPLTSPNMKPEQDSNTSYVNRQATMNSSNLPHSISESKVKLMCWLISFGTLLIIIRSVYRAVELTDGWEGAIAVNEPLFLGMDAFLMCAFVYLYAIIHPGLALGRRLW